MCHVLISNEMETGVALAEVGQCVIDNSYFRLGGIDAVTF